MGHFYTHEKETIIPWVVAKPVQKLQYFTYLKIGHICTVRGIWIFSSYLHSHTIQPLRNLIKDSLERTDLRRCRIDMCSTLFFLSKKLKLISFPYMQIFMRQVGAVEHLFLFDSRYLLFHTYLHYLLWLKTFSTMYYQLQENFFN